MADIQKKGDTSGIVNALLVFESSTTCNSYIIFCVEKLAITITIFRLYHLQG